MTELGKEKRKIAKDVVREFNEHLEAQLTERERKQFVKLLQKVNEVAANYVPTINVEVEESL